MALSPLDYDYHLPANLIANQPSVPRDSCRLLAIDRHQSSSSHYNFSDLSHLLTANDVLVLNQTKVFPARLLGRKSTGGQVEILLLRPVSEFSWECLSRPALKKGTQLLFDHNLTAVYTTSGQIKFPLPYLPLLNTLNQIGKTPIPPYIHPTLSETKLRRAYQTVYADPAATGSAAAPTAGLHFTPGLLNKLQKKGIHLEYLTLHVGLGTFQPLRDKQLQTKTLHPEFYEITPQTAANLNQAKINGRRIIAVGTTSVRALESAVVNHRLTPGHRSTTLFIYPPYRFQFVDGLITNFHLPQSSLLMLVSAFSSAPNSADKFITFNQSLIGRAYQTAIKMKYRFFSFGDAMIIL